MIIDPRHISLREWAHQMGMQLSQYEAIPSLTSSDRWQEWAAAIIALPAIGQFAPPSPYQFGDWSAWAARFIQAVPL